MTAKAKDQTEKRSTFHITEKGYDTASVDKFTEEAYSLIDTLSAALHQATNDLKTERENNLSPQEEVIRSVEIISLAGQVAGDYLEEQRAKADELLREATEHHDQVLGSVNAEREAIEEKIERLKGTQRVLVERLKALHQNELDILNAAYAELTENDK